MSGSMRHRGTLPSHLKVTTFTDYPFSGFERDEKGNIFGTGYAFEILNVLVEKYNFTYQIIPPKEDVIGDASTGVIGQLVRKEVDMAAAFLPLLTKLREIVDFGVALEESDITFLMKRPGASATGAGFLAPFTPTVWYCILVSIFVVGPLIYLVIFLRSKFWADPSAEKATLFGCLWFAYGGLLKQGSTVSPIADSTRLLFATWWIFITILTSYYTANLTACLTLSKFTLPINTIAEMVHHNYYWFSMGGRTLDLMMKYNLREVEPLQNSLKVKYGEIIHDPRPKDEMIWKHIDNKKIFLVEKTFAENIIARDFKRKTDQNIRVEKRCTYVINPNKILVQRRGFAYPLNSSIQDVMNLESLTVVESGILKYMKRRGLPVAELCPLNLAAKDRRLRIADLWLTFEVVFFGFSAGTVIFILELFLGVAKKCWAKGTCCFNFFSTELTNTEARDKPDDPSDPGPEPDEKVFWKRSPPPPYEPGDEKAKQFSINGRPYHVITEESGDRRLVPIRTPSALLYQYNN